MNNVHARARLATVALVVLAVTSLVPAPTAVAEAFTGTSYLAEPVVDPATVWTGDEVLLLGGRNATGPVDTIQTYDPATGEGRVLDTRLPQRTHGASAVWDGEAVYVFGGAHLIAVDDPSRTAGFVAEVQAHNSILRFDPATGNVTTLEDRLPEAAFGIASVWTGERALLYGGVNRTLENGSGRTEVMDWVLSFTPTAPAGERVERVGSLPAPIMDLHAAWTGDSTVLVGGWVETRTRDGQRVLVASDRVLRHEAGANSTKLLEPRLPTTLRWAGAATANGSAYLFGGCRSTCNDTARHQLETVVRVNLATGHAQRLHPTLPAPRIAPAAVATPDGILVLGGGRGRDRYDVVFDDVRRFQPGPTPPLAPGNLTLQGTREGVDLAWEPPTYDGGANLTAYRVERARPGSGFTPVITVAANRTHATDATAPPGVNLTYRVRAMNVAGEGEPGLSEHVTPPARPPSAPQRLEAVGLRDAVLLRWSTPVTDGGRVLDTYQVLRNGTPVANVTATTWTDMNLTGNDARTYTVRARNTVGWSPAAGPVTAAPTVRLPPPRNLTVKASDAAVQLAWDPPAEGNATHYQVLQGSRWDALQPRGNVTGTTYQDTGLDTGEVRWYAVAAVNATGPGAPTRAHRAAHVVPPGPPGNLTAEAGPGRVVLSWNAPGDDGDDERYYLVTRSRGDDAEPTYLNPDRWTETSLVDDDAPPGTSVTYRVRAVNAAGAGPWVNLTVTVPLENVVPVARLSAPSLRVQAGDLLSFDASASHDPDGRVVRVRWSFGDGTATAWTGSFQVLHRFETAGNHTVSVQVRDDHGAVSPPANVTVVAWEAGGADRDQPPEDGPAVVEPPERDPDFLGVPGVVPTWVVLALAAVAATLGRRRQRRR